MNVSKWMIDVTNCSLLVYSKINNEYLITRYYIDEYQLKLIDNTVNSFKFYITYRTCPLKKDDEIDDSKWKNCNYVINCDIKNHVYIDSRYDKNSYNGLTLCDCDNSNHIATSNNVVKRLKSTKAKLI